MTYIAQLLKDGSIYEKDGIYIKYYTEKQFSKYKPTANIVGCVKLKNEEFNNNNNNDNILVVKNKTKNFQFKINEINQKDKVFGYIYVGENNFIKIIKPKTIKKFIIILSTIIIALFLIIGCFLLLNKEKKTLNNLPKETEDTEEILLLSEENTEIPLYVSFNLDKKETINLSNPNSNTVDFKYEIYENNNLLFSTNYIKPGDIETITMSDYLNEGEHNVILKIRCFINDVEVNGTEEPVVINIK